MEAISIESAAPAVPDQELVPITANQRIEALDVVRGFALLGIFLMNIEYFNRTLSSHCWRRVLGRCKDPGTVQGHNEPSEVPRPGTPNTCR